MNQSLTDNFSKLTNESQRGVAAIAASQSAGNENILTWPKLREISAGCVVLCFLTNNVIKNDRICWLTHRPSSSNPQVYIGVVEGLGRGRARIT